MSEARACPRCRSPLEPPVGALEEEACASCGGRLLPARAMQRLLVDERGLDLEIMREVARELGGPGVPCPHCAQQTTELPLKGERVDLCFGCGGVWLDPGELGRIGEGRHAEIVVPEQLDRLKDALSRPPVEELDPEEVAARAAAKEEKARRTFASVLGEVLRRAFLLALGGGAIAIGLMTTWGTTWRTEVHCARSEPRTIPREAYLWRDEDPDGPRECEVVRHFIGVDSERRRGGRFSNIRIGPSGAVWADVAGVEVQMGPSATRGEAQATADRLVRFNRGEAMKIDAARDELKSALAPAILLGLFGLPFVFFALRPRPR